MKKHSKLLIGAFVAILALTIIPVATFAQQGPDARVDPVQALMRALTDTAAQTLNMTPEDFVQAMKEGKTPAQLAEDAGVATEDLTAAMQTTWNAQGEQIIAKFIENGWPKERRSWARDRRQINDGRLWVKAAAETLNMSAKDFVQALRQGQTPAQIAEAHGSSGQPLIDAIVAAEKARLDKAVADGKLTQEKADAILANRSEAITTWVETGKAPLAKRTKRDLRTIKRWTKLSAETLDMPVKDFVQAQRQGQTPAQIAEAHGSSGQALIDAIVTTEKTRLDKAVADGKLTQEKADAILSRVTEKATKWVENGLPQHPHNQ